MSDRLISIIVPVYKTPVSLLQRFIKSVLGQTFTDIELIAVNDASPDRCPTILDEAASGDSRMTVIHRSLNGRAGMARNDGLARARGWYVFFADADDFMQPDMCKSLVETADFHSADIVCQSVTLSNPAGHCIGQRRRLDRTYDLAVPRDRSLAYGGLTFALWDKIFRREVIDGLRFEQYEANIGEDTLFNVAAFCRSRKMVATSYAGYAYTIHASSATGRAAKGMSYLKTLYDSGWRIRQTIEKEDGSRVGRQFADLMDLKRFATGCGWIAHHPDEEHQISMWRYWRHNFRRRVLPNIAIRKGLAAWCRMAARMEDVRRAYWIAWPACRLADPLAAVERFRERIGRTSKIDFDCKTHEAPNV